MPYDLSIPGQISEHELRAIEVIAGMVPERSTIVELGSLFGRSSYAWAKSVPPSAEVVCIDPFAGNKGIRSIEERLGIKYGLESFLKHTEGCDNIRVIQGFSPDAVEKDWSDEVFLYFDDSVHTNPGFKRNLDFWSNFVASDGILCGDDHRPRFTDIQNEVERYCRDHELWLMVVDFMWIALNPRSSLYDADQLRNRLSELKSEADQARSVFRGVKQEGVRVLKSRLGSGYRVEVDLSNPSLSPISVTCHPPDGGIVQGDAQRVLPFDVKFSACFTVSFSERPEGTLELEVSSESGETKAQYVDLASAPSP
ncbi:MAG: class I SAM-dependent methyltransferase [Pseudomonadota bacterium]